MAVVVVVVALRQWAWRSCKRSVRGSSRSSRSIEASAVVVVVVVVDSRLVRLVLRSGRID